MGKLVLRIQRIQKRNSYSEVKLNPEIISYKNNEEGD
jgi:hypothetical protein